MENNNHSCALCQLKEIVVSNMPQNDPESMCGAIGEIDETPVFIVSARGLVRRFNINYCPNCGRRLSEDNGDN